MKKIVLIDGNSIMNRAFYGIMGSKMLMTKEGTYTNAIYGFLAILFKILEDINPEYLVVAFDLKAPTQRHKLYEGYKATRKGMPNELAEQMPIIKEILRAMNIDIIEKEGYEADDILGTLSRYGEKNDLEVTILSGDRDTFQLATDKVTIRIPRTKAGKTETEEYNREKIIETYGIEPKQLIEVKGLQGDTSDNIPGVPGIGEKTALSLIKEYNSIENLYEKLEKGESNIKGKQKEKLEQNKELAFLSKTLGTINLEVPIEDTLENFKVEEWDKQKVFEIFEKLRFQRFIERFNLREEKKPKEEEILFEVKEKSKEEIIKIIKNNQEMIFYLETCQDLKQEKILKEKIKELSIYNEKTNESYYIKLEEEKEIIDFKEVLEDSEIKKVGINLTKSYILLKQIGITLTGIDYDIQIAGYILDPTKNKLNIDNLSLDYLDIDVSGYLEEKGIKKEQKQMNLFENNIEENIDEKTKNIITLYSYLIYKIKQKTKQEIEKINAQDLFSKIDMPTVEVLSNMQWNGMYVDEQELNKFGEELKNKIEIKTKMIYEMAGEEFNINSTKQLGEILFEKMKLPICKKTKTGYSI